MSKVEIAQESGASKSTVATMRRTLKALKEDEDGEDPSAMRWEEVLRQRRYGTGIEHDAAWEAAEVEGMAAKLRAALGPKPNRQPELCVRALALAYPRLLETLEEDARALVEEPDF